MTVCTSIYQAAAGMDALRKAALFPENYLPKYDRSKRLYIAIIPVFYVTKNGTANWYDEVLAYEKKPGKDAFKDHLQNLAACYEKELIKLSKTL